MTSLGCEKLNSGGGSAGLVAWVGMLLKPPSADLGYFSD